MNDDSPSAVTSIRGWNFQPELPLRVSPLFIRPFSAAHVIKWFVKAWLPISERLIILGLAFVSWFWLQPPLEQSASFAWGWVLEMYARNIALMVLVAGGLHLYFFTLRCQGDEGKYDTRPLASNNRTFTLNNQVHDNMFWTLASGVTVWTAYEALMFWGLANGYVPWLDWSDNPVWFVCLFLLIPFWEAFHFYWIHRLIHFPFLYKHVHALHHRNINVGPWSGLSMHPVEHIIYLSAVLIHFLVAAHPLHILYHLQFITLTAATTHTGYQGFFLGGKLRMALGTYHHQMHHRYFECNYGSLDIPMDAWAGSFHDGTENAHAAFQERRRLLGV